MTGSYYVASAALELRPSCLRLSNGRIAAVCWLPRLLPPPFYRGRNLRLREPRPLLIATQQPSEEPGLEPRSAGF